MELRSSLIKSGILLGLFIFLIYAFAAGDSGGIGGTIGSLFSALLFIVGLFLALVVSVLILIGIYFAILYMYDQRNCKTTYDEFKEKVSTIAGSYSSKCCTSSKVPSSAPSIEEDLKPLRSIQEQQNSQLTGLQNSVDSIAGTVSTLSASVNSQQEELANLESKTSTLVEELENKASAGDIDDSAKKLSADITTLQNSVNPLSDKLGQLEETIAALAPGDEDESEVVQEKINQAVSGLQNELAAVKESLADIIQSQAVAKDEKTSEEESHRILTYFTNENDKKKFAALVDEAVDKGMTYAQVGKLLDDSLSAKESKIIGDHPSLTKDYIREIRQQAKK